jgi:hypothetical protein
MVLWAVQWECVVWKIMYLFIPSWHSFSYIMQCLLKQWYLSTRIHELTFQKTIPLVFIGVRILKSEDTNHLLGKYFFHFKKGTLEWIFGGKLCYWLDVWFGLNTDFNVCLLHIATNIPSLPSLLYLFILICLVAASNRDSSASTLNGSWLTDCCQQSTIILGFRPHQE